MIKFSKANTKLKKLQKKTKKKVYSFDILSGVSCPFAKECHSWAKEVIKKGKKTRTIVDGPHCKYRCYSASQETIFPKTYNYRKENSKILTMSFSEMVRTLTESLPQDAQIVRIHSSGDFNSQRYFDAWLYIAEQNPQIDFYTYTKALPYWIKRKEKIKKIKNFVLTASYGGTHDYLIVKHRLRSVRVVLQKNMRDSVSHRVLPLDTTDYIAYNPNSRKTNFSLLIHGIQPAGSLEGQMSYKNRKRK